MRPLLLSLLVLTACAPDPDEVTPDPAPASEASSGADVDVAFTDEAPPGAEQIVITTRQGDVDLGLTDEVLYFRLNAKKVDEIEAEIDEEIASEEGLGRSIAEAVTGVVTDALRHAVQFPLEDVESVTYEGGRLEIEFVGDRDGPNIERDGEPIEEAFAPEDARRFVAAFNAVTRG